MMSRSSYSDAYTDYRTRLRRAEGEGAQKIKVYSDENARRLPDVAQHIDRKDAVEKIFIEMEPLYLTHVARE